MAYATLPTVSAGQVISTSTWGNVVKSNFAALWPFTTNGDMAYATGASNDLSRLAIGSTNQVITVAGGVPTWANGSKATLTTTGDLLYASAANTLARLGIGATGTILAVSAGLPAWRAKGSALQYLRTNSGATDIEWATITPAEWTLVASGTFTGTSLSMTGLTSHKRYRLTVLGHRTGDSSGTFGSFTATINGSTNSFSNTYGTINTSGTWTNGAGNTAQTSLTIGGGLSIVGLNSSGALFSLQMLLQHDDSASQQTIVTSQFQLSGPFSAAQASQQAWLAGYDNTAVSSITRIDLSWSQSCDNGIYILEGSNS